jgi:hypothetical protein
MTIRRMRIVCRILKATNTHSQYVILITFSQKQCLHLSASMLGYTQIACLVNLHTRLREYVTLTIQPLYTRGNNLPYPLSRAMGKPRSRFGRFGGEKNFFSCPYPKTVRSSP